MRKTFYKSFLPFATTTLIVGVVATSFALTSCGKNKPTENSFTISTQQNVYAHSTSGLTQISVDYTTSGFNPSLFLDVTGPNADKFTIVSVSIQNKKINVSINDSTPFDGVYYLQFIDTNNNITSNAIKIIYIEKAYSDTGVDWEGYSSGSLGLTLNYNHTNYTATIAESLDYIAQNLVIPEYIASGNKIYTITAIAGHVFDEEDGLTGSLYIADTITTIGNYSFEDDNITSVHLSNNLISIGEAAFDGTHIAGNLTFPMSLTTIGNGAFAETGLLTRITIPNTITEIGTLAFGGTGASQIVLDGFDNEPSWGNNEMFYGTTTTTGTVDTINGTYTKQAALAYLINYCELDKDHWSIA